MSVSEIIKNTGNHLFFFHPFCRYMKYLYPYECDKRGLSNPNELQAAIDSNRREGRRQGFGGSLFTYSPNGTPTMLSSPKLTMPQLGITLPSNGASLSSLQKVKKGKTFWCSYDLQSTLFEMFHLSLFLSV